MLAAKGPVSNKVLSAEHVDQSLSGAGTGSPTCTRRSAQIALDLSIPVKPNQSYWKNAIAAFSVNHVA